MQFVWDALGEFLGKVVIFLGLACTVFLTSAVQLLVLFGLSALNHVARDPLYALKFVGGVAVMDLILMAKALPDGGELDDLTIPEGVLRYCTALAISLIPLAGVHVLPDGGAVVGCIFVSGVLYYYLIRMFMRQPSVPGAGGGRVLRGARPGRRGASADDD